MNKISAGNMVRKMSCVILFFSIILPAVGEAPYQKVTSHGLDIYFHFDMGSFIWQDIEKRDLDLAKMAPGRRPRLDPSWPPGPAGGIGAAATSRYYGNAKLVFIEKCGHYSWIEQPDEVFSVRSRTFSPKTISRPHRPLPRPEAAGDDARNLRSRRRLPGRDPDEADDDGRRFRDPLHRTRPRDERRGVHHPSQGGRFLGRAGRSSLFREYMDIEPSLSPDGTKIVFVSNRPEAGKASRKKCPISGWPKNPEINGEIPSV